MAQIIEISSDSDNDLALGIVDDVHSTQEDSVDLSEDNSSDDADDGTNSNISTMVSRNGVEWEILSQSQNQSGRFNSSNILRVAPGPTLLARQSIQHKPISDAFWLIFGKGILFL